MGSGGFLKGLAEELTRQQASSQERERITAERDVEKTKEKRKRDLEKKVFTSDAEAIQFFGGRNFKKTPLSGGGFTATEKTALDNLVESFDLDVETGELTFNPAALGIGPQKPPAQPTAQPTQQPPTQPTPSAIGVDDVSGMLAGQGQIRLPGVGEEATQQGQQPGQQPIGQPVGQAPIGQAEAGRRIAQPKSRTTKKGAISFTSEFPPSKEELEAETRRELEATLAEMSGKEAIKGAAKVTTETLEASSKFTRVANIFSGLVAQGKLKAIQQRGLGLIPGLRGEVGRLAQRITGKTSQEQDILDAFGGIAGFESQLQEVILALGPILTNQNRFVRAAAVMIRKTAPTKFSSEAEFAQQVKQSLENSFKLTIGISKNKLSVEQIEEINNLESEEAANRQAEALIATIGLDAEEQKVLDGIWNNVKNTPPARPAALFNEDSPHIFTNFDEVRQANLPAGTEFIHIDIKTGKKKLYRVPRGK